MFELTLDEMNNIMDRLEALKSICVEESMLLGYTYGCRSSCSASCNYGCFGTCEDTCDGRCRGTCAYEDYHSPGGW